MRTGKRRVFGAKFGLVAVAAILFLICLGPAVYSGFNLSEAIQGGNPTGGHQQKSEDAQTHAPRPPSFLALFFGGDLEEAAAYCASDQQDQAKGWIVKHWCDVKRTDVVSAGSAVATVAVTACLLGAALLQWRVVAGQRDIAREQTTILEAQARTTQILADLERPVLFVRGVESVEFEPYPEAAPGGAPQRRPLARIRFANYGRTPAVLLGIEGTVAAVGGVRPEPDYSGALHREMRLQVIEAGEEKGASARIEGRLVTDGEAHLAQTDQLLTIVYGRLVYRDAFGDRAVTGFGYLLRSGTVLPLPLGAYNYRKTYGADDQGAPHADYEL